MHIIFFITVLQKKRFKKDNLWAISTNCAIFFAYECLQFHAYLHKTERASGTDGKGKGGRKRDGKESVREDR